MDITFNSILSVASLLVGGSGGAFFTWRFVRREAKAKAQIEEVNMAQKVQDTYQQMLEDKQKEVDDNHRLINELREDRDRYKQGYIEFRDQLDKLQKEFRGFRTQTEDERATMKRDIARNGRQLECMRPFLCGRGGCHDRLEMNIEDNPKGDTMFPTPYGDIPVDK